MDVQPWPEGLPPRTLDVFGRITWYVRFTGPDLSYSFGRLVNVLITPTPSVNFARLPQKALSNWFRGWFKIRFYLHNFWRRHFGEIHSNSTSLMRSNADKMLGGKFPLVFGLSGGESEIWSRPEWRPWHPFIVLCDVASPEEVGVMAVWEWQRHSLNIWGPSFKKKNPWDKFVVQHWIGASTRLLCIAQNKFSVPIGHPQ